MFPCKWISRKAYRPTCSVQNLFVWVYHKGCLPFYLISLFANQEIRALNFQRPYAQQVTYDDHIVSSCMGKLCQISRVKDSFDKDTLCLMVSSLVMSKVFYCSSVWSKTSSKNVKTIKVINWGWLLFFAVSPMLTAVPIKLIWQNSFRQDSWLNWNTSGDNKVSCSFTLYS